MPTFRYTIVKAVRQRESSTDFASAFESRLEGVSDSEILDRAASEGRILVTHDRRTMLAYFRARLEAGRHGIFSLVKRAGRTRGILRLKRIRQPGVRLFCEIP